MRKARRRFVAGTAGLGLLAATGSLPAFGTEEGVSMYGLIGKMTAADGKRDELITILLEGMQDMPGCLSYVVAKDPGDAVTIWVTEVWTDEASHQASLSLPSVQAAIQKGRPLIAGMQAVAATEPVGGHGLSAAD